MCSAKRHVRFTPESDTKCVILDVRFGVISGQTVAGQNPEMSAVVRKRTFGNSHIGALGSRALKNLTKLLRGPLVRGGRLCVCGRLCLRPSKPQ
jgi:hypothetical protein